MCMLNVYKTLRVLGTQNLGQLGHLRVSHAVQDKNRLESGEFDTWENGEGNLGFSYKPSQHLIS